MKKRTPQEVKGKQNEERVIALTRSLKGILEIQTVKKAGTRLDAAGVDVKVFLSAPEGCLPVLIQVKSSWAYVAEYNRTHPECLEAGVIVIVANEKRSDDHIKTSILCALQSVQTSPKRRARLREFYATARKYPLPSRPKWATKKGERHVDESVSSLCGACGE